jgi:hypothetical protein
MKVIDARDKIFAIMVFGNETYEMESLPAEVRPNYEKNVLQVYADFTRWWILHHKSLRILSAVRTLSGRSWVNISGPRGFNTDFDLSQRPSWMLWYEGFSQWMHGTLALHDQCEYHASWVGCLEILIGYLAWRIACSPLWMEGLVCVHRGLELAIWWSCCLAAGFHISCDLGL